jgi:Heterokaryon incompatibility protein (HET)
VNAICIDQHEEPAALNERSRQVQLMKQIYEQATKVLVWLGKPESEANNRLAYLMMREFELRFRRIQNKGRPLRIWWWKHKPRTIADDMADFLLNVQPATDKTVFDVPGSPT